MTISKTQAFSLLEGLTEKSLTFGCLINVKKLGALAGDMRTIYPMANSSPEGGDIFIGDQNSIWLVHLEDVEVLGHPVTLPDVMQKVGMSFAPRLKGFPKKEDKWNMEAKKILNEMDHAIFRLTELWAMTTGDYRESLQGILEGATWEKVRTPAKRGDVDNGYNDPDFHKGFDVVSEVLKDEKVEALILFIQSLKL